MYVSPPGYEHISEWTLRERADEIRNKRCHEERLWPTSRSLLLIVLGETGGAISYYTQTQAIVRRSARNGERRKSTYICVPFTYLTYRCNPAKPLKRTLQVISGFGAVMATPVLATYVMAECAFKLSRDRIEEIHGPYRHRSVGELNGEYPEERAKRQRKERRQLAAPQPKNSDSARTKTWMPKLRLKRMASSRPGHTTGLPSNSPLLNLPFEVREMIWQYALAASQPLRIERRFWPRDTLFYSHNGLVFDTPSLSTAHATPSSTTTASAVDVGSAVSLLLACRTM